MKKLAVILTLCILLFSSCAKKIEFTAPSGEYTLECRIGEVSYIMSLELSDDHSGRLTFDDGAMANFTFSRTSDGKIKCLTSLGSESEACKERAEKIFDFVILSYDMIADAAHERISGKDVSVLRLTNGSIVYTDSQSGEPLRLVFDNMTVDILSRPG